MEKFHHIYRKSNISVLYAWWLAMHTRIDIVLIGAADGILSKDKCQTADEPSLLNVVSLIYDTIDSLEHLGNFYSAGSELSELNDTASSEAFAASDDLFEIIRLCKDFHTYTDGLFDISFRSADYDSTTSDSVLLDEKEHSISFAKPGIKLDLCGVIKGYALSKVQQILQDNNVNNALINLGNSSVLALGSQPDGSGWNVGFSNHDFSSGIILRDGECLSMSGNVATGHSHIMNPKTGLLVETQRQLAVVTRDPSLGDALSTALFCADEEQKMRIAQLINGKIGKYCQILG